MKHSNAAHTDQPEGADVQLLEDVQHGWCSQEEEPSRCNNSGVLWVEHSLLAVRLG